MPGFGIPCPQPDTAPIVDVIQSNECALYDTVMKLLEPLSYSLTVGTDQLAEVVKSLTGCIKKDIRSTKKTLTAVATDATYALVQGTMLTGSQLADVLQFIPSGVILGSESGSLRGTPGAGLGGDILLGGGLHPFPMPKRVDPSRPDLHTPPVNQTTTPQPLFQVPLPTVQQPQPQTGGASSGETAQPETTQPQIEQTTQSTGGEIPALTTPKITPSSGTTEQPGPVTTSPVPTTTTEPTPAATPEATEKTSPETTTGDVPGKSYLFNLKPLEEFDVGTNKVFELSVVTAAQQSEAGQQPAESYSPLLFGD